MFPKWVMDNPEENIKKISGDQEILRENFPAFKMLQGYNDNLFIKGDLISTKDKKNYLVELYYPDDYPRSPIRAMILSPEVIACCNSKAKNELHYLNLEEDGVEIDLKILHESFDYPISYYIFSILVWIHFFESRTDNLN
jgi:hypothetical protein